MQRVFWCKPCLECEYDVRVGWLRTVPGDKELHTWGPSPINNAANFIVDRAGFWFHGDRTPTSPRFFCFTASLNPLPSKPTKHQLQHAPPMRTRCALYIFRYFDKSITTGLSILWEFDNKKGRTQHADWREANLHPILWENNRIRTHLDCNVMVKKANVKSK